MPLKANYFINANPKTAMNKRPNDIQRGPSVIDASLNCLVGDGPLTKDVLFKIQTGALKGADARDALAKARYDDWKNEQQP